MRIKMFIIATAATLALTATAAQAATVYTPPLTAEPGGTHACSVANVSTKALEVTIEILGSAGTVLNTTGPNFLAARRTASMETSNSSRRYCRVIVKGRKGKIRVSYESRVGDETVGAVNGF